MQQVSSGFRHLADSQEVDVLAAMDSDGKTFYLNTSYINEKITKLRQYTFL